MSLNRLQGRQITFRSEEAEKDKKGSLEAPVAYTKVKKGTKSVPNKELDSLV